MNKLFKLWLLLPFVFGTTAKAQLILQSGITPAQLVTNFVGTGLTVSNINLKCSSGAYGTFSNGNSTNLGLTSGVALTTGSLANAKGPNNVGNLGTGNYVDFSDPNLTDIEHAATNDPCVLTFNVTPTCNTLTIKFVFGSEEYHEWVNRGFNDIFGFFITGANPSGGTYNGYNIARLPNNTVVSIDNINNGQTAACSAAGPCKNCSFFIDNCKGNTIQYDGFTKVITSNLNVVPCSTYTFKVAIADAGDHLYDSGVFINSLFCSTAVTFNTSAVATCSSQCKGTATASGVSGGQPPYTYTWNTSPVQTTATATGLCAGTYSVTVKDNLGCITNANTATVSISSLAAGNISISSSSNVNCNGANSGSATATISAGSAPYTYVWSNGQTVQTATGLSTGTYTVTGINSNGCTKTSTISITQPALLVNTVSSTTASCSLLNGTATANPSGGTPAYTYSWSNGKTTKAISGLAGGTYTVTVTDSKGCSKVNPVNVASTLKPSVTASSTQTGCGLSTGTGTANPSGGTSPYSYNWTNGQTTQTTTGLGPGSYFVTVSDKNACTATAPITVSAANGPTVTLTPPPIDVSCYGASNGSATATAAGGTGAYTYAWSNGQTTPVATGLIAGTYTAVITDANACSYQATVIISQPTYSLTSVVQPFSNVNCNGGNNGSATANASGGTPGYTYLWSNGQTTQTASNLVAGTYSVNITDAKSCKAVNVIAITQPGFALTNSISPLTNVSCNGADDGNATASTSGGTPGYTYTWFPGGETTQTISALVPGNYSVAVVDANGCTASNTVNITQPNPLSLSVTKIDVFCNGGSAGSAMATTSGGTPGYTFLWSNGQTTSAITGLSAGDYSIVIKDANGCIEKDSVTVTDPILLSVSIGQSNLPCFGGNTGFAVANTTGGTAPYAYNWSTGQTTASISGLVAGTYSVSIIDANGCTSSNSSVITQPPLLALSVSGSDSICRGKKTTLSANVTGGVPAYVYTWNPAGQTSSSISVSPTASTTYSATITDANGCFSAVKTFTVSVLPNPVAGFDTSHAGNMFNPAYSFHDLSNGGILWYWNFGDNTYSSQQNPVHTFPGSGNYPVWQIVHNKFGCVDSAHIDILLAEHIIIPNIFTPNGDGKNDVFYIPNSGMQGFHIEIYDRWGLKVFETNDDEIRWDGRSPSGKLLSDGTYYFILDAVLKTSSNDGRTIKYAGYVTILK